MRRHMDSRPDKAENPFSPVASYANSPYGASPVPRSCMGSPMPPQTSPPASTNTFGTPSRVRAPHCNCFRCQGAWAAHMGNWVLRGGGPNGRCSRRSSNRR